MIIVGELINASRKKIKEAIEARDADYIAQVAREQAEAGADYIDVNAGVFLSEEAEHLSWLVQTVQGAVDIPCCIDSPNPKATEAALKVHKGTPMINSISMESARWETLLTIIAGTEFKIIALCMSDAGMPETADQRMGIAKQLIEGLTHRGVAIGNIYVDPLVQPVATNSSFGSEFLETVWRITSDWPEVHKMCGLSNISFGLPERKLLNQVFMVMAVERGLDGAIVNPLDKRMMANIITAEALIGRDEYCARFLKAFRQKRLVL